MKSRSYRMRLSMLTGKIRKYMMRLNSVKRYKNLCNRIISNLIILGKMLLHRLDYMMTQIIRINIGEEFQISSKIQKDLKIINYINPQIILYQHSNP